MTPNITIGVKAPDFHLSSLDKKPVSLKSVRAKVVLLNFWSPGCNACEFELAFFDRLQSLYRNKGLAVIGINAGGTPDYARNFLKEKKLSLSFPIATDPTLDLSELYGIKAIPTTFLLDHDHIIHEKIGSIKSESDFERIVQTLLN